MSAISWRPGLVAQQTIVQGFKLIFILIIEILSDCEMKHIFHPINAPY